MKMKKFLMVLFCFYSIMQAYAQQLPIVAVSPFDVRGGITQEEAEIITELLMTELGTKNTVKVVDRNSFDKILGEMRFQTTDWSDNTKVAQFGRALNANCIIYGQLMRMGNVIYMINTMIDVNTTEVIYSAREQLTNLGQVFDILPLYCSKLLANVPSQNPFVGRWMGSNGSYTCILVFNKDGTILVERYDGFFHDIKNRVDDRRSGNGTGNYSITDNQVAISLSLRNINNKFTSINTRADYMFNDSKERLTFTRGGIICFYAYDRVLGIEKETYDYYRLFTKIK